MHYTVENVMGINVALFITELIIAYWKQQYLKYLERGL